MLIVIHVLKHGLARGFANCVVSNKLVSLAAARVPNTYGDVRWHKGRDKAPTLINVTNVFNAVEGDAILGAARQMSGAGFMD